MNEYVVLTPMVKNFVQGNVTVSKHYREGDIITLSDESAALHLERGNIAVHEEPVMHIWTLDEEDDNGDLIMDSA